MAVDPKSENAYANRASAEGPDSSPLRNRNLLLFLVARFIAVIGQQMLTVAVGWELYERTHSTLALGLVGLTEMAPIIALILPAGHVADNRDRKRTVIGMELLIVVASIGLALVSAFQAPVYLTYACLLLAGVARTFMRPSSQSLLPQLVPRHLLSRAITWNAAVFQTSSVLGPAVGGALIALTHHAISIYIIDAAAGLLCAGLFCMVRAQQAAIVREPMSVERLLAGFKFVYRTRMVLGMMTLDMFAVLLGGATALLPVYAKDILNVGPSGLGLLQAALPIGSVLSAIYLAHRKPLQKAGPALLWAVVVFGLATIAFGFSKWFWFSFAMLFVCGVADNVSVVVRNTVVQMMTPDAMRGRVSAVNSLFIGTSNELGGFESGSVAHLFGPVFAVVSGGIGTIVMVGIVAFHWPEIRRYGRLDGS